MKTRAALLFVSLGVAASWAGADGPSQKVYRCGPDGRVYSQTPCKDGYEVAADDARSAEQRKAAEATLKSDTKATERMTREREAKERVAARQGPAIIADSSRAPPVSPAASAPKKKNKRPISKPSPQT